jgi:putative transposase
MAKLPRTKQQVLDELLDELLEDCKNPEDLLGESGMLKQLTKGMVDRMLKAEMSDHLGYEKNDPSGKNTGNSRNGKFSKTIQTGQGPVPIEVPRDRNGEFEPRLVPKGQRRFKEFDDKIISLYARGMTTREIQGHLRELYGSEVSPELISRVTDGVLEEVAAWQSRPLDGLYPIVYLDAIFLKIRDSGTVQNKAVHLALGINMQGEKELLGLWIAQNEGAKFWLSVLTELKNRGLKDILIACVDGLTGFPEAVETAFPETLVQLCIVHKVRHSLSYVTWKDRKAVVADLKTIYKAATAGEAETQLGAFSQKWDKAYPSISRSWRKSWDQITPFFAFPPEIRKVIYTTNAIESMNSSLRKIIKNRGAFPTDEAATKLLYLAIRNIAKKWSKPIRDWKPALNRFAIMFEGRVPLM